jgi:hypothetical protein
MSTQIHFLNGKQDERWMSSYSRSVLESIGGEAKINRLVINSAIRTSEAQASAMYANELLRIQYSAAVVADEKRLRVLAKNEHTTPAMLKAAQAQLKADQKGVKDNTVRYAAPGTKVQAIVANNIATAPKDTTQADLRAKTLKDMLAMIDKVGLINVTNHAGKFALEVFDVGIRALEQSALDRLRKAIRRRMGVIIYRFGSPTPAPNNKYEFPDGKCFHLEILQPGDYESSASSHSLA